MNYKEGEIIELDDKEYIIYSIIQDGEKYYYYLMSNFKPIDMKFATDGDEEGTMNVVVEEQEKLRVFDLFKKKFN